MDLLTSENRNKINRLAGGFVEDRLMQKVLGKLMNQKKHKQMPEDP